MTQKNLDINLKSHSKPLSLKWHAVCHTIRKYNNQVTKALALLQCDEGSSTGVFIAVSISSMRSFGAYPFQTGACMQHACTACMQIGTLHALHAQNCMHAIEYSACMPIFCMHAMIFCMHANIQHACNDIV
jgi:hypothetical protein